MTLKEEFFEQFENKIALFYCGMIWNWTEEKIDKTIEDAIEQIRKIRDKEYSARFVQREYNALNVAINVLEQLKEKK
jgi:hypothetical protein